MASFEVFKKNRMPSKVQPSVTIQRRGAISLNTAAFEAIGSPSHVELLYDRDERLIGLRSSDEATPHAYLVRGVGQNEATHVVSGKAFLTYYDIPQDVARRWAAEERDGVLVVDLKQPGTEVSGHNSRAHRERSG
jgi:hypothetical protein